MFVIGQGVAGLSTIEEMLDQMPGVGTRTRVTDGQAENS